MVILDENGIIRDVKVVHFPEVNSPGFSKWKAKDSRVKALSQLLDYAYYHGVRVVFFEDLERIKRRNGKAASSGEETGRRQILLRRSYWNTGLL